MGGKARIPARYAIDWIKLGADGSRARGDESRVASWHGHGAEVLAVADAVVADARDDVPGADSIGASKGPIGQPWRPAARPTGGPRSRELPAPNVVVRFGPERP
jgi:hypothetical protein